MRYINLSFSLLVVFLFACSTSSKQSFDKEKFKNPPSEVHVHTWWHWIDGRITREGITKDLESMKAQGISQATILNIGMKVTNSDVKRIPFNTPEWYAMFKWALTEANRLGISIGVHNCDGWSESGGPWITPEMSMKKFVFTKTTVSEENKTVVLPQPLCDTEFYRDVAVVAFPDKTANENRKQEQPVILMNDTINGALFADGNPESMLEIRTGDVIRFSTQNRQEKTRIILMQNFKGAFYFPGPKTIEYTVKASNDGIHYRKVAEIATDKFYVPNIIDIPKTSARFFLVEVSQIHNLRPWHHAALSEVQLLGGNEKPAYNPTVFYPLEKTASARIQETSKLYTTNENITPDEIIPQNEVIDLTDKMQADGTLNWTPPAGSWSVIRFGYTTTGAQNGPATPEGTGLECDKMDTAAVNLHFRNFPQKLIDEAGQFTGNTFKFLMIDSWERGYQTWTKAMPQEFEKLRGYDLIKWIPTLCGETVSSTQESEAFLYDFRKTIADLFEQNYYKHFNDLCHRNHLQLHGEVIYGDNGPFPPVDVLRTNDYMDMPMYEFWADKNEENLVEYKPTKNRMINFPVYASNFYDKPVIGAEAYTGHAHFSESPNDLKLFGDRAFCSGINQMILHSYVHQPDENQPGFTLGQHGSHFNRNNPPWNFYSDWMAYQARIQYIMQNSKMSSDILYFLGDQLPQFFENKVIDSLPDGYQSVPCNYDVLTKLYVEDGKVCFSEEQKYALLVLPDQPFLSYESLKEIERLLSAGAVVYGTKPQQMLSFSDIKNKKEAFNKLVNQIWSGYKADIPGENKYGKGTTSWGRTTNALLAELNLKPDFTTHLPDTTNLMFLHKNTENTDVFFVVNQQDSSYSRMCYFNTVHSTPEIWNPETGEVTELAVWDKKDGVVFLPVNFEPKQSLFFIFSDKSPKEHINKVETKGKQLFPPLNEGSNVYIPDIFYNTSNEFQFETKQSGAFVFTSNEGKVYERDLTAPVVKIIDKFAGKIIFYPVNSKDTFSSDMSDFKSFTDYTQPRIKYFSGTALYQIDFDLLSDYLAPNKKIFLDLGKLDATAEVSLNGENLGDVWLSGTKLPVAGLLKENNHLDIKLATTCRNRFIGDLNEFGEVKNLWTSRSVTGFLKKDSSLKPSGIIGPLQLIKYD